MTSCRKPAGVYGYGKEGREQPTLAVHTDVSVVGGGS